MIDDIRIDDVFFAQTHVLPPDHPYFRLVGGRDTLIKIHVLSPSRGAAPGVDISLTLDGESTTLNLSGPSNLPATFCNQPGKVIQQFSDCFTTTIPGRWIRKGLHVTIRAGQRQRVLDNLRIGPPIRLNMILFDVHYFDYEDVDYPEGWAREIAVRRPLTELKVQRMKRLLFPEVVIPPRGGHPAVRCSCEEDYQKKTGTPFNGKQIAALAWQRALQAAGAQRRLSLFFINIANVHSGGFAEDFGGCGSLRRVGILHHELAHSLDVEDLFPAIEPLFPYRGKMHGIDKTTREGYHIGPSWGYDPRVGISPHHPDTPYFISPIQSEDTEKDNKGEWKSSPARGGGGYDAEAPQTYNIFSDWSVRKMQAFMENRVVLWDEMKQAFKAWNGWTEDYSKTLKNDGVTYPVQDNVDVYSVMVSVSAVTPEANFIYPVIGPYRGGLIDTFDPENPDDRRRARRSHYFTEGCDICLRVTQGGRVRTYMMPLTWRPDDDPKDIESFQTKAINLPVSDGTVSKAELLLTPDADVKGPPENPRLLFSRDFPPESSPSSDGPRLYTECISFMGFK